MKFSKLALVLSLAIVPFATTMNALEIGDDVPAIKAIDHNGHDLDLGKYCDREDYALVFFYPKAETPGCIMQVCSLRDAFADLSEAGVAVIGVSVDGVEAQKNFHENRSLPYPLIADYEKQVTEAFGVPLNARGMAKRQAYLFKAGVLVWMDESAATEEQAEDVLAAIKADG